MERDYIFRKLVEVLSKELAGEEEFGGGFRWARAAFADPPKVFVSVRLSVLGKEDTAWLCGQ